MKILENDSGLILALQRGEREAFEMLYNKHFKHVYRFVFSFIKEQEQAKDTVQDAFLALWLNRYKLDPQKPVQPYLYTICHRKVLDRLRMITTVATKQVQLKKELTQHSNETEEAVIYKDLMAFASFAIEGLPNQQKVIVKLKRLKGFSNDEIAVKLNLSKNTVRNHLIAAGKNLRSLLQKQNVLLIVISWFLFIK